MGLLCDHVYHSEAQNKIEEVFNKTFSLEVNLTEVNLKLVNVLKEKGELSLEDMRKNLDVLLIFSCKCQKGWTGDGKYKCDQTCQMS
jgi:hypothetical protein